MGGSFTIGNGAAFTAAFPLAITVCAVLWGIWRSKGKCIPALRTVAMFLFAAYAALAVSLLFFPLHAPPAGTIPALKPQYINVIPFASIAEYFGIVHPLPFAAQMKFMAVQVGGNLLLLAPLGFFAPLFSARFRSPRRCLLLALGVSVCIELLQLAEVFFSFAYSRATDIDDVLLNVAGAALGFFVFRRAWAFRSRRART